MVDKNGKNNNHKAHEKVGPDTMNRPPNFKGWLEILLAIAAIIIIPLFFAIRSQAGQTANTNIQPVSGTGTPPGVIFASPPLSTPTVALPTAAPVAANGKEPPPCTFPLVQIKTVASTSENYTFSGPQVALTAPKGNFYHIIQWIPDNQQVLITEDLLGSYVYQNNTVPQQSISLYNAVTGASKVYAIRPEEFQDSPAWNPALSAVVYPATNYTSIDKAHHTGQFTRQLWISHGDPNAVQKLADNLSPFSFGIKPDGSQMIYRSGNKISGLDKSLKSIPSISFDPTQWDYAKNRRNSLPISFEMAWQPGTSLVFLYSEGANLGGGYTFILNADTGKVCELNLGGWAEFAHWSSDGRYLAIVRSVNYTFPTFSAELTVLDTVTGKLEVLHIIPQQIKGGHYANDFAWAPDNRHLLAIGEIYTTPNTPEQFGLYLIDSASDQGSNVTPAYKFYTSLPQSIAWSPDGSKVAVLCPPGGAVNQICLISVQKSEQ